MQRFQVMEQRQQQMLRHEEQLLHELHLQRERSWQGASQSPQGQIHGTLMLFSERGRMWIRRRGRRESADRQRIWTV